ncbi:hypothetical protein HZA38_03260 [Candidatus Peregrinibacteria bacterium]|nr:hypothetical protein [Candidatus Peregrinibacteria bacterium]
MNLEKEIQKLQDRNTRVELDKAWEISFTRRFLIFGITFLSVFLFVLVSGIYRDVRSAAFSSLIPASAFLLSMLAFPTLRKFWEQWK